MPTVHFRNPSVLALLAVLPVLALLWWRACRVVDRTVDRVAPSGSEHAPSVARLNRTRGILRLLALAALILAVGSPALLSPQAVSGAGVPLVFVLDVSSSMRATDVSPNRLDQARWAIDDICALAPNCPASLVVAAQDAVVVCPLTDDRAAFAALLDQVDVRWMSMGGTELRGALELAGDVLRRDAAGAGIVVLVSDGEDHGPTPLPVIQKSNASGIVVHTLTVGSVAGARLADLPPTPFAEPRTEAVLTCARPEQMAAWAQAGGGRAWSISPQATALPARKSDIVPRHAAKAVCRRQGSAMELSMWLYLVAAGLLIGDWLLRP